MLAAAYAYGHLVPIALALAMGAAFALLGARLAAYRADLAYAACALLAVATGAAGMVLALAPSLLAARLVFSFATLIYVALQILWRVQFAEVLPESRRGPHARLVAVAAVVGVALSILHASGALDEGRLRPTALGGSVAAMPYGSAALVFVLALLSPLPSLPLLLADGPRRRERRSCVPVMAFAPLLCAHDLLVAIGLLRTPLLGPYLAGLATLQGVIVLTERFRALTRDVTLGPYRIEALLGEGGMAEVFVARRQGSGALRGVDKRVALKRLRPEHASDPELVALIVEEARTLSRLSHPNIVALHDAGVSDDEVYLVLELVKGPSLAGLVSAARERGSPLGAKIAIEIGIQTAAALAWAHGQKGESGAALGLVHRDVSPQNLLVDASGTVKLADFGIARSLERHVRTKTRAIRGKVPYIAPERLRNEPYDHLVDLYALGVVMFEVATGVLPFDGGDEAQAMYQVLSGEIGDTGELREASPELAEIVLRLLDRDPARRPRDAAALREALLPLRDEESARAALAALAREHEGADRRASPRTRRIRRAPLR